MHELALRSEPIDGLPRNAATAENTDHGRREGASPIWPDPAVWPVSPVSIDPDRAGSCRRWGDRGPGHAAPFLDGPKPVPSGFEPSFAASDDHHHDLTISTCTGRSTSGSTDPVADRHHRRSDLAEIGVGLGHRSGFRPEHDVPAHDDGLQQSAAGWSPPSPTRST